MNCVEIQKSWRSYGWNIYGVHENCPANPIFFNKKIIKIGRTEHSLSPHLPTSDNISFLSYICVGISLFNKVAGLKTRNLIKKRLQHRHFPVNIEKFLRTAFLQNTSGGCFLLFIVSICCFKFQINKRVLLIVKWWISFLIHEVSIHQCIFG